MLFCTVSGFKLYTHLVEQLQEDEGVEQQGISLDPVFLPFMDIALVHECDGLPILVRVRAGRSVACWARAIAEHCIEGAASITRDALPRGHEWLEGAGCRLSLRIAALAGVAAAGHGIAVQLSVLCGEAQA